MKKTGGPNSFNLLVIAEMECMHRLLACVRETLLVNDFCFIHFFCATMRLYVCKFWLNFC